MFTEIGSFRSNITENWEGCYSFTWSCFNYKS